MTAIGRIEGFKSPLEKDDGNGQSMIKNNKFSVMHRICKPASKTWLSF